MAITFWRNVQRKITTQEMDASFDTLVNDIANAGISSEMPEGTIYIGDNTNTASLETLDTSIVPETTDKRYQSDLQDTYNDATSSIQGQLDSKQTSLGYTPENSSNKTDTVTGNEANSIKYLSVKGVYDWATGLFATISNLALKSNIASPTFTGTVTTPDLLVSGATASTPTFFDATKKLITTTAQLWGAWVQTWSNKATPVDADTIGFHDSASTFVGVKSTLLNFWTAYLLPKVQALGYLTGSGLTSNHIPYWNGTNMINSIFQANTSNLVGNNSYSILNTGSAGTINIGTTGAGTAYVQLFSSQYIVIQGTLGNSLYGTTNIQTSGGASRWAFNPSSASLTMSNTSNVVHSYWDAAGLNVGGSGASSSAILQADSTTKGFLPPRMTNTQRTNIVSPAIGLMVYCTDATEGLYIYKSTGWTFII